MRYTNNMEPQIPNVRSMLSGELAHALEVEDGVTLAEQLSHLKEENSPTAAWAEAIGARLQIRDFLVQQKGGLAALQANNHPDLRQNIANYLHSLDTDLSTITGHYGQDRAPATTQELKDARLVRLTQEPADKLVELTVGFSSQDSDKVLSADYLIVRTINIRNDVVECLWSAAQSYSEGSVDIAKQELDIGISAVNSDFDTQISTILTWEEAA